MSDAAVPVDRLLEQLAAGRQALREERAAVAGARDEANKLLADAKGAKAEADAVRKQARKVAARYLKQTRAKVAAERKALAASRAADARDRQRAEDHAARTLADRDRIAADTDAAVVRLQDGWATLAAQQERFAEDRKAAEAELSRLFGLLDARTAETESAEATARAERKKLEENYAAVRAEAAGLEQRAANARLLLAELEQQRAQHATGAAVAAYLSTATEVVPLAAGGRSADELAAILHARELELAQERRALAAARAEIDKLATYLTDQRAILADQYAAITDARRKWHEAEVHTVVEMEHLARELDARETSVGGRESAAAAADDARRKRHADLWAYHTRLEAWQAALVRAEATAVETRDAADAEVAARRGKVADREAAVDEFCRIWDERHAALHDRLVEEVAQWVDDRKACVDALADCDHTRTMMANDAAKLAAATLAVAEAKQGVTDPKAARRLKVLEKRWAGRFAAAAKDLDRRRKAIAADAAAVEQRYLDLRKILFDANARQKAVDEAERGTAREELAAVAAADEPVILSYAAARPLDPALDEARRLAEATADGLMREDESAGVFRLRAA